MKEKNGEPVKKRDSGMIVNISIAVLFLAVLGLTAAIIALLNITAASNADVPFRMEQLTSSNDESKVEVSGYLVPAFIGISAGGEQKGISAGINIVSEIYHMITPVLYDVLAERCEEVSASRWDAAAMEGTYVYVKYHAPLPYQVIHAFAGGTEETYASSISIYELFILPDKGFRIVARTADGAVYEFDGTYESYFSAEDLVELMQSYRRNILDFVFSDGTLMDGDIKEPLFTERVRTKNMLVTGKTAALIQNNDDDITELLRLMDFNPDKLYAHEESDVGFVYVENHGVMRLLEDSVEYTAASSNGGVDIGAFLGYYDRETYRLLDYISAACMIMTRMRNLNTHYMGGDADIVLDSASSDEDGSLVLRFVYTFDNLRLAGCEPVLEVRFRDGAVKSLRLYSVSVRNLGEQYESFFEQWYYDMAVSRCPEGSYIADVRLVYKTDFYSESINAEWSVVYGS